MNPTTTFGFPDEWDAFARRNHEFLVRFPSLRGAFDKFLRGSLSVNAPADRVILLLGRLCLEDFMETLLLAGNGYGFGALKIVRGMYERAVVHSYLALNPAKAKDFIDYARVEKYKCLRAWSEAHPNDVKAIAALAEVRIRFEAVESRYAGKTWSGLDFVSLAKKSGPLGKMLGKAYYVPLAHAHGTAQSLEARITWSEEHSFEFHGESQPKQADEALKTSHEVMLHLLAAHQDYFIPGPLNDILQTCVEDFVAIWQKNDTFEQTTLSPNA